MDKFRDFYMYIYNEHGHMIAYNESAWGREHEAFELLKELWDNGYGSIDIRDNLVSIHTGGWSENEALVEEFKKTLWWFKYHEITCRGGHYYCNTDTDKPSRWEIFIITGKLKEYDEHMEKSKGQG